MKTPSEQLQPDLKIWASQQLQISQEATEAEARHAFLAKLAEHQFVPPPAVQESFEYWLRHGKDQPSLLEQAYFDEENRLRGLVDDLAREFFTLSPYQRQKRWTDLRGQCQWSPVLRARLEALEPGLMFDPERFDDATPHFAELVSYLTELFVLPPRERAVRRGAIVQDCRLDQGAWEKAAKTCQERYPELTRFEPFLLDELAWGKARRNQGKPRLPVPVQPPQPAPDSGGGSGWSWGMWPVFAVVFLLIRLFSSGLSTPRQDPPPFPQQFQVPKFQPPKFEIPGVDLKAKDPMDNLKPILGEDGMKEFNELNDMMKKVELLRKRVKEQREKGKPMEPPQP